MANEFTPLYVAYSIVWAGVFLYLVYIHLKQRSVDKETRLLKEEVVKHGK
ncbi:MAG TPA: CcmD family protein [Thermoplasmata archaeon]|jgi:CcmD family protein